MNSTHNGNGRARPLALAETMELPAWMQSIRDAVSQSIKPEDLKAIMGKQIEKAKQGDERAAKFVMDQARNFSEMRGMTLVQNNNYYNVAAGAVAPPDAPAPAGTSVKVDRMARRLEAGLPLHDSRDRPKPISDEEEKELHRREEQED
jgi:hypothetical protein